MDKDLEFENTKIYSELKKFEEERKKLFKKLIVFHSILCICSVCIFFAPIFMFSTKTMLLNIASLFIRCTLAVQFYVYCLVLFPKLSKQQKELFDEIKKNIVPKLLIPRENLKIIYKNNCIRTINEEKPTLDSARYLIDDYFKIYKNNKQTIIKEGSFDDGREIHISHEMDKKINSAITISRIKIFQNMPDIIIRLFIWFFIITFCYGSFIFLTYLHIKSFTVLNFDFIWKSFVILIVYIITFKLIYRDIKNYFVKQKQKVHLEDINFCKNYKVTAKDQVEARYILTPVFIETLNKIKSVYNAKKIHCTIHDCKIYLKITTNKNLFEIGSVYKTLLDKKVIEKFNKDIDTLLNLVECLG